jgi:hypothetical protein
MIFANFIEKIEQPSKLPPRLNTSRGGSTTLLNINTNQNNSMVFDQSKHNES